MNTGTQQPKSSIRALVEGENIVIRVSIKDLIWVVENDPEYTYKVHDPKKFAEAIVFELENSKSFRNNEGMNAMEELFQNAYERVYENGEDAVMTGQDMFP